MHAELLKDTLLDMPTNCRLQFPKDSSDWGAQIKVCEIISMKDKAHQLNYDTGTVPKINDLWLVSHPCHLLESL